MTDLIRRIPQHLQAQYHRTSEQFTPTVQRMKFGNTPALRKLTPEALGMAMLADEARETWQKLHDTHWAHMGDTTQTEQGRLVRSAKHARQQLTRIDLKAKASLDAAARELERLRGHMDAALRPPSDPGQIAIDGEVRAMLRAESNPEKALALIHEFPRAVATAPRALSGAAESVWENARSAHLRATVPDQVDQYTDLLGAVESMSKAVTELEREAKSLIDFNRADALEAQAVAS